MATPCAYLFSGFWYAVDPSWLSYKVFRFVLYGCAGGANALFGFNLYEFISKRLDAIFPTSDNKADP